MEAHVYEWVRRSSLLSTVAHYGNHTAPVVRQVEVRWDAGGRKALRQLADVALDVVVGRQHHVQVQRCIWLLAHIRESVPLYRTDGSGTA